MVSNFISYVFNKIISIQDKNNKNIKENEKNHNLNNMIII